MDRLERIDLLDDTSSSSSSSSDEELERRPRVVKPRNDLFEEFDEIEFQKRFRLSKNVFRILVNLLNNLPEPMDNRNQPISKENQILVALRFYATGSFQLNIGDHFNISQPSVSRIVSNVTSHIASLSRQFIKMPTSSEECRREAVKFYNIGKLPGIIGALDCTHIKMQSPGGENAEVFRNRKSWFSINTQAVVDADLKIRDIVARWPGSIHDSTIFNDSHVRIRFENQEFSPYCLVGDGGYPCKQYLLTPLLNPQNAAQQRYNRAQISTRNCVERCFGVWKRRFPCLSLGMRIKLETLCNVIVACAVLQNMCLEYRDELFPEDEHEVNDDQDNMITAHYVHQTENTATQDSIIATIFN